MFKFELQFCYCVEVKDGAAWELPSSYVVYCICVNVICVKKLRAAYAISTYSSYSVNKIITFIIHTHTQNNILKV